MAFRLSHSLQDTFRYALRSQKTRVGARIRLNIFDHRSAFADTLRVLCHCFTCHGNERERQQFFHHRIGHSTPVNLSWANGSSLGFVTSGVCVCAASGKVAEQPFKLASSNVGCHSTLPEGSCSCNAGTIPRLAGLVCRLIHVRSSLCASVNWFILS